MSEPVRVPVEGVDFASEEYFNPDNWDYHPEEMTGSHISIADGIMEMRSRILSSMSMPQSIVQGEPPSSKNASDEAWECYKAKFVGGTKRMEPRRGRIVDYVNPGQGVIDRFDGEYRFLSNFHMESLDWNGRTYPSSEHAYNASKAMTDSDHELIASTLYPYTSKQVARTLPIRPDWDDARIPVMESILRAKFGQAHLKARLLATGDRKLVEGNWWGDRFWGRCLGTGTNHLGHLLMKLRSEYAAEGRGEAETP